MDLCELHRKRHCRSPHQVQSISDLKKGQLHPLKRSACLRRITARKLSSHLSTLTAC